MRTTSLSRLVPSILAGLGFATLFCASAHAEVITVSPADGFAPIEAAGPGDEVLLEPGTYRFRLFLQGNGTAEAPIIIRAADPSNKPVWDLSGMLAEDFPGSSTRGDRGRGCWQVTGSHYQISGIVVTGCTTASGNAAGVRSIQSESLILRDIEFRENDVGLSGDGENTLVEFSEFIGNGRRSSPPQHSTYIFGGSITMRHNYIHDSRGGQNLHIRAVSSVIEYNWIARASNYEIDMMTNQSGSATQEMIFRGNVLITGESPENSGQVFVMYNDGGGTGPSMTLRLIGNTILVRSGSNPTLINVRDDTLASAAVEMRNNVVVGTTQIVGTREGDVSLSGGNNWLMSGSDTTGLGENIFGDDPMFQNAGELDFRPTAASPLVGAAGAGFELSREYFENEANPMRFRFRDSTSDIGAFEHDTAGSDFGAGDDPVEPPGEDAGPGGSDGGGSGVDAGVADAGPGGSDAGSLGDAGAGVDGSVTSPDDDGGCSLGRGRNGAGWLVVFAALLVWRRRR